MIVAQNGLQFFFVVVAVPRFSSMKWEQRHNMMVFFCLTDGIKERRYITDK